MVERVLSMFRDLSGFFIPGKNNKVMEDLCLVHGRTLKIAY